MTLFPSATGLFLRIYFGPSGTGVSRRIPQGAVVDGCEARRHDALHAALSDCRDR
jgi:hypothetical protein